MKSLAKIESELNAFEPEADAKAAARRLLALAEAALTHWIAARGETPTNGEKEGFRLLALHRQGAHGVPSFNACRESCREIAFHYNMLHAEPGSARAPQCQSMMALLVTHLTLFVSGKLQVERLGEFCCSSRSLRSKPDPVEGREENGERSRLQSA